MTTVEHQPLHSNWKKEGKTLKVIPKTVMYIIYVDRNIIPRGWNINNVNKSSYSHQCSAIHIQAPFICVSCPLLGLTYGDHTTNTICCPNQLFGSQPLIPSKTFALWFFCCCCCAWFCSGPARLFPSVV